MKALPWYFGVAGLVALAAGVVLRGQAAAAVDQRRVSSLYDRVTGTGDGGASLADQAAAYSTWSTVLLVLGGLLVVFAVIAAVSARRNAAHATRTA